MRTLVVGYDGSESAKRALGRVAAVVGVDARVLVVTAIGKDAHPGEMVARRRLLDEAAVELAEHGISAERVEATGEPAKAILREVKRVGADLVVVGTRGRSLPSRVLLGSVSTKLVLDAPCDVLLVR